MCAVQTRDRVKALALLLLVVGGTAILATVAASSTSAQARIAALPAETPARTDNPITPERVALVRQLNMRGRGQQDIIAFLRALDDPDFDRTVPERVPSGLPVGGRLQQ